MIARFLPQTISSRAFNVFRLSNWVFMCKYAYLALYSCPTPNVNERSLNFRVRLGLLNILFIEPQVNLMFVLFSLSIYYQISYFRLLCFQIPILLFKIFSIAENFNLL